MATQVRDLAVEGFERVVELSNEAAGLRAFVAVHSLALGPGLGGARMFAYASRGAALRDVCDLSRGMSYKNALAGIPFGGGKAVIQGDPATKSPELLQAFAEGLNALNGDYLSAEDSGIAPADMRLMGTVTKFVAGADRACGGGNPAPYTAKGVFLGLKTAVAHRLGRGVDNQQQALGGLTVGIEGLGQVGYALAQMLRAEGARVIAAELNSDRLVQAERDLGVEPVTSDTLLRADIDVFAPCAMGGAVSADRLPILRAPVIAGAANNQLENAALGDLLASRDQLYAPDYVINAAGVISIAGEYLGCWSPAWLEDRVQQIPHRLQEVFTRAERGRQATSLIADRCARELIRNAGCLPEEQQWARSA